MPETTRLVRFGGAMSLGGIAGPNAEYDWIVIDPEIDFAAMSAQVDTYLIGRKTFEAMGKMGNDAKAAPEIKNIVFSRTLKQSDYPHITVSSDAESTVAKLRRSPGKDIALFGGGELFRSLLAAGSRRSRRSRCDPGTDKVFKRGRASIESVFSGQWDRRCC